MPVEEDIGDCNTDGTTDIIDIGQLSTCVGGPASTGPAVECDCYDLTRNGHVDMRDVTEFLRAFDGP